MVPRASVAPWGPEASEGGIASPRAKVHPLRRRCVRGAYGRVVQGCDFGGLTLVFPTRRTAISVELAHCGAHTMTRNATPATKMAPARNTSRLKTAAFFAVCSR
jgi:hypothetical protein